MTLEHPVHQAMSRRFEGKVVVVTGASRGIGAATARLFAREGAIVVLAARSEDQLSQVASDIKNGGGQALGIPTDVSSGESVKALIERTMDAYGRLDAAFNNAGMNTVMRPLAETSEEDFDLAIAVNLKGVFLGMKYQIPAMLAAQSSVGTGGGAIVNMSSTAGVVGANNLSPYVAAKHGVVGLTKAAALDYAKQNIRVNCVAPGPILNDRIEKAIAANPQVRDHISAAVPMGRIGLADEVAETVLWLCSDAAAFITGVTVPVDGGRVVP